MSARTRKAYDTWAATYDTDPNPHTALEHVDVLALVAPRRGEAILDAGCGTGKYTMEFSRRGARVTGIDFSAEMLACARQKCPRVEFLMADLTRRLPFPDGTFDKINCAQTLKHLQKLKRPMRELARVLRPGGILVFSVTHPEMNWDGYALRNNDPARFRLTQHADIFHHRFYHYFEAIEQARLQIDRVVQIPVCRRISKYVAAESYRQIKGRYQIVAFRLRKPC